MKPQEFAIKLHAAVVEENTVAYRDLFSNSTIENTSDAYWKRALAFFSSLEPSQREVFFEILRQVAVDTTSNILGVMDGVNSLEGGDVEFQLIANGDEELNGDLQSIFLAEEEKRNIELH
ncbi:transposase [Chitinimonas arctica]|uniref:Transposase n=1 Tax=Chitinimonas arctica TaxID=2594795 RepID=A0A516SL75_9NEIS|nr:transposase [Chitinimonas arctica]QDQ28768.1 transposase [Chitinimonas arctica]